MGAVSLMEPSEQYGQFVITRMVAGIEPITVERAQGCSLFGRDGREYLDCFSGISVVNAGHGHPKVLAAARSQMEKLVHCGTYLYYAPTAGQLAERLAELTPGDLKKTFFANSGAEAIEGALRLAKQATGRREVVALTHSFHGRTLGTLSVSGNSGRKRGFGPYVSGTAFGPSPYCYRCPLKLTYPSCGVACAEALEDVVRFQTAGDVAAFLMEPIQGEGGIIVPPPEYFNVVSAVARKAGALLLIDEVQTGFGRTGALFASEHYALKPDMMMLAKGIANGFPLSAFIVKADLAEAFQPGDHLSTFGGNPVSCAAALATLEVIEGERLAEQARIRGEQILKRLRRLQERFPLIGEVRGKGLMIGMELVRDVGKTPADKEAREVKRFAREAGVLLGVGGVFGNVVRVQPPLVINAAQCDRVCDVIESALTHIGRNR